MKTVAVRLHNLGTIICFRWTDGQIDGQTDKVVFCYIV